MKKFFWMLFICCATSVSAQPLDTLSLKEPLSRLQVLGDSILKGNSDSIRAASHSQFSILVDSILQLKGSEQLSMYQIKALSVLRSPDKKFILYNWMLTSERGNKYNYFGYINVYDEALKSWKLTKLTEQEYADNQEAEVLRLNAQNWLGCIYYKIIIQQVKKKNYYLLLGWAPHTASSTRKIIETISFTQSTVNFGVPQLKTGGRARMRMIFEYSSQATMSLRWEENKNMVIMDNLSSTDPRPESKGMYSLYGPDMSYNALKFDKGFWYLSKDVDIRNMGDTTGKKGEVKKLRITKKSDQ